LVLLKANSEGKDDRVDRRRRALQRPVYWYQADVSVWAALDVLLAKKLADQLVLEPTGEDDLEGDLHDEAAASVTSELAFRPTAW
jgi:hypothetical protein